MTKDYFKKIDLLITMYTTIISVFKNLITSINIHEKGQLLPAC